MKVSVDAELCILCELCEDTCPDIFEMGPESSRVKVDVVPKDQEECVRQAAESCPTEAITIEE